MNSKYTNDKIKSELPVKVPVTVMFSDLQMCLAVLLFIVCGFFSRSLRSSETSSE